VKRISIFIRFWVMGWVLSYFLIEYGIRRLGNLFVRGKERRRSARARTRGKVMRRAMALLGATFVKLGQVLSTRPDLLDDEIIDELRKLQDKMPPFAFPKVRSAVEADTGKKLSEVFSEFDEKPVAAASVAQVHRARLTAAAGGAEVAVKVLRPDVRKKVERDGAVLVGLAKIIALHPTYRLSDPVGHMRHFVSGIEEQTNLRLEAENYRRFRKNFEGFAGVHFPKIYTELSGERSMTMEFMRGHKVDALPPGDHSQVASIIQRAFFKMCFEDGFVHADLHPGNVLVVAGQDGASEELAIFDVGLVKLLSEEVLVQFIDFTKCVTLGSAQDFITHMKTFHTYNKNVDWVALEVDVTGFVERFRKQNVAELELGIFMNELFAMARRHRVRPIADLALVIVGIVTAEGIGKQLNPKNNLFQQIATFLMPILMKRGITLQAQVS
jgi:ubiquinone biosynthesis protein